MTIRVDHSAKKVITAEAPGVLLRAELIEGKRIFTVRGRAAGAEFKIDDGAGLDTMIELLHAVKAERANQSAPRRLTEAFDAADIIAVDEATA